MTLTDKQKQVLLLYYVAGSWGRPHGYWSQEEEALVAKVGPSLCKLRLLRIEMAGFRHHAIRGYPGWQATEYSITLAGVEAVRPVHDDYERVVAIEAIAALDAKLLEHYRAEKRAATKRLQPPRRR